MFLKKYNNCRKRTKKKKKNKKDIFKISSDCFVDTVSSWVNRVFRTEIIGLSFLICVDRRKGV